MTDPAALEQADRSDADLMLKLAKARVAQRALYKLFGPRVGADGWDQWGSGEDAVPMPVIPFNLK